MPLYLDPTSFGINLYVVSGGMKASLATIADGQGGQQNRQHKSLNDKCPPEAICGLVFIPLASSTVAIANNYRFLNPK